MKHLSDNYAPLVGDSYAPERIRVIIPVGRKSYAPIALDSGNKQSLPPLAKQAAGGVFASLLGKPGHTQLYLRRQRLHQLPRPIPIILSQAIGFSARYNIKPRIHIKYQPNVPDLGSADSARINMEYYELNNPVFAVQGDNIFDIKVKSLIDFHKEKCACLTIVLREVDNVEGLGIADIDKYGRIQRFVEKPAPKDAPSNLANTGLYVLSPEVRKIFKEKGIQQIIKEKNRLDFGYDFIPYIIESGRPVYGYTLKGSWFDVGTPKSYLEAMKKSAEGGFSTLSDFGGQT